MKRKAQAAMEYLMTYGWVVLIIIIVAAALYALGVFDPCTWIEEGTDKWYDRGCSVGDSKPNVTQAASICKVWCGNYLKIENVSVDGFICWCYDITSAEGRLIRVSRPTYIDLNWEMEKADAEKLVGDL